MFLKEGFTPVCLQGGPKAPRVFSYANREDTIEQIMEPGYFNSQKIILLPNSFIKVVAKDAFAELLVEKNAGHVAVFPKAAITELLQPRAESGQFTKKTG